TRRDSPRCSPRWHNAPSTATSIGPGRISSSAWIGCSTVTSAFSTRGDSTPGNRMWSTGELPEAGRRAERAAGDGAPYASSDRQVATQLGHVTGGAHVVLRQLDPALLVDEEGGADDAGDGLAVHLLLPEGAPLGEHRAVGVRQQREGQRLGVAELG